MQIAMYQYGQTRREDGKNIIQTGYSKFQHLDYSLWVGETLKHATFRKYVPVSSRPHRLKPS